jgi:predicted dithiol-disulfide oxidoreductase (DUF899 family)
MTEHRIGTREEWLAAREQLLVPEKEHTRLGDELARQRRELPWVPSAPATDRRLNGSNPVLLRGLA